MLETPRIVEADEQITAVVPFRVPRSEIAEAMGAGRMQLIEVLARQGIEPTGPWFSRHHRMDPDWFDFEVGLPVARAVVPEGSVVPSTLPAGRLALTVYHGGYEGLGTAWSDFMLWLEEGGYRPAEQLWEHYAASDDGTSATVLCRPVL